MFLNLPKPDVSAKADPTPCKLLATNKTPYERPNANVIVDKKSIQKFHFDTVKQTYVLAADLPYGKHTLQLFKRTEWDKGKTLFYGFAVDDNVKLLSPPELPKRKIEYMCIKEKFCFFQNSTTHKFE